MSIKYKTEYQPETFDTMRSICWYKVECDGGGKEIGEREYVSKQEFQEWEAANQ